MKFLPSKKAHSVIPLILLSSVIILGLIVPLTQPQVINALEFTSQPNQQTYILREPVTLQGSFSQNGVPVSEALIALEISDPRDQHFAFRTIPIGNPDEFWSVNITDVSISDLSNNPLAVAKIDTSIRLSISLKNNLLNSIDIVLAYTLFDNNLIPIRTSRRQIQISPQATVTVTGQVYIPKWVTPGNALISVNAFNELPQSGGIPYTPEKLTSIYITRNDELPPSYAPPPPSHQTQPGEYQIYFRMPPDQFTQSGTYSAHLTGMTIPMTTAATTTSFDMQTAPSPPQAAFTYYPTTLYANMSATFDASSSSAEGFNDTIIQYAWYFDDPNNPEHIVNQGNYTHPPTPLATHTFEYGGSYTVSLNVTDNEGLWSYTLKPITIYPEYGPTANFTWTPSQPRFNNTVTFNASITEPGWSAKLADFSPITQYTWNFDDGTGNITIPDNPVISHIYTQPGNYTVTLTVVDSEDRTDSIIKDLEVLNITNIYDINDDGYVGVDDIVLVAEKFGTSEGDPDWDPRCDVTGDGFVGIDDIVAVAEHFGEEY